MFTGLITHIGTINFFSAGRCEIRCKALPNILIGASVACSGVCLTVVEKTETSFSVDISEETLMKTTASQWQVGDILNLEFSLKMGDELGGHFVFGHVDNTIKLLDKIEQDKSTILSFELSKDLSPFVVEKGSVALNGVSLTVNNVREKSFDVTIIPHTFEVTNLKMLTPGDSVNVEVDMLARYVSKQLELKNAK